MKSFQKIKNVHGEPYLHEITPYYDEEAKETGQRSMYIAPIRDGESVEKCALSYAYYDILPTIKTARVPYLPDF